MNTAALFDCSYYGTILKPILKQIEKEQEREPHSNKVNTLKKAAQKAYTHWLIAEPNQEPLVKTKIMEVIGGSKWYQATDWDSNLKDSTIQRILHKRIEEKQMKDLIKMKTPNLLLLLSEAPTHMIIELTHKITKDNGDNQANRSLVYKQLKKSTY